MKNKEPTLAERMSTAAKAKQAQLEKARAMAPANNPGFAERQAARRAVGVAREVRIAERKVVKAREIEDRAVKEAAQANALKTAQAIREAELTRDEAHKAALAVERTASQKAELAEKQSREVALGAERKATRDARYAARKARKR